VTRLEAPPIPTSRERVLTPDEIGRIWHACPPDEYGRIVKLCIVSGHRMRYRPEYCQGDVIVWPRDTMKADRSHTLPVTPL
jgi:integrase